MTKITGSAIEELAIKLFTQLGYSAIYAPDGDHPERIRYNEVLLTEGVKVSTQHEGNERGEIVWLIDFDNPGKNEFVVASQFTVIENNQNKRPDLVVFVNGMPLVVIELKNAADENASIQSAFRQLETYKRSIPGLFTYNALLVISDGLEAKAGSLSAGFSRFMTWKIPNDVGAHCMRPYDRNWKF